jgi:UDP-N-acetylmuramate dehydrogenase
MDNPLTVDSPKKELAPTIMSRIQPNSLPTARTDLMGSAFTTYRIGGPLDEAYLPENEAELLDILHDVSSSKKNLTVLGWGGNSIIATAGIRGVTLILRKLETTEFLSETRIRFGAGVHLARAASVAQKAGLHGGEYMIGIPGTIGGAIRMNAGALAQETADLVRSVRIFNLESKQIETKSAEELEFSYRKSGIIPDRDIILSAELDYTPGNSTDIMQMMDQSVHFRKTHHPKEPNGGSVFKNPAPDKPVGRLMEELGAKGNWREGAMMVSPLHGNFIINLGGGTSTDTLKLMRRMQVAAKEAYDVNLHPENLFLGDATPEEKELWQTLTQY